nr:MAG TPA: hypothetical protein [Bacteriophage sp.]
MVWECVCVRIVGYALMCWCERVICACVRLGLALTYS